jgi:hypothetical protein
MQKKISHPYHLDAWGNRLERFSPKQDKGVALKQVSEKLLALYRQYPERRFYEQLFSACFFQENDEVMPADEYLSFVWSNDGWLGEQAYQYISDGQGNYNYVQEPLQFKIFDTGEGRMADNLDFEKRLFSLVDELVYSLYQYDL